VVNVGAARSIPLEMLPLPAQRYACHGCGDCCRDFTVQLREGDLAKLRAQRWEERLGVPVTSEFRGRRFLAQREDGACVFLGEGGKCRIHAEFGLEEKPLACQMFPFVLAPDARRARAGVSFACASVLANKGPALASHAADVRRMAAEVDELVPVRTMLDDVTEATPDEPDLVAEALDRWLRDASRPLAERLDGVAWLAQQLSGARFTKVRGARLRELMDTLVDALPDELPLHPVEPASRAQRATLRQAAFFRLEDPKIGDLRRQGKVRAVLGQYLRSRRFSRGRGGVPAMGAGWGAAVTFDAVERVCAVDGSPDAAAIDELLTRWMRATVLGGRAWGSGFYGWSVTAGLQALALNAACVRWLAHLHAAGAGRGAPSIEDVRAALSRVDRASGRAPWIGSRAERLRLSYLRLDDGLRRILTA
jgi:lysine-N-methylase